MVIFCAKYELHDKGDRSSGLSNDFNKIDLCVY